MLFADQVPQDKGLFTFYREEAEREEQIRRHRKLTKQMKKHQLDKHNEQLPPISPPKEIKQLKTPPVRKTYSLKESTSRDRPNIVKKRLIQSVVDMAKHVQGQRDESVSKELISIKIKDSSILIKSRRYKEKIGDLNLSVQQDSMIVQENVPNQLKIQSFHRRNSSEQLINSRAKPAIHSSRGSVELPDIRKLDEQKPQFRPKKSIKSRFIEQALKTNDRDKIRNIRQYIRGRSSFQLNLNDQQLSNQPKPHIDSQSFAAFQLHQQRVSSVLKKLKRRL